MNLYTYDDICLYKRIELKKRKVFFTLFSSLPLYKQITPYVSIFI